MFKELPAISAQAVENYFAAGIRLRKAVIEGVDGIENNFDLKGAIENHELAEKLLEAARGTQSQLDLK